MLNFRVGVEIEVESKFETRKKNFVHGTRNASN